jgi:hypothetical protein
MARLTVIPVALPLQISEAAAGNADIAFFIFPASNDSMHRLPASVLLLSLCLAASVAASADKADIPSLPSFSVLRLDLSTKPPAQCTASLYGTIAARSPGGALCLCHQSYNGTQSFWEQIGTGWTCWPDTK